MVFIPKKWYFHHLGTLFKRCNIKLITCYNLYKLGTFKSVVDLTRLGIKLGASVSGSASGAVAGAGVSIGVGRMTVGRGPLASRP